MGLLDVAKKVGNVLTREGWVTGSSFPAGTLLKFGDDEGEKVIRCIYPNNEEFLIRHESVKEATVLGMGVISTRTQDNHLVLVYGVKYKVVLNDGKVAIVTCNLDRQNNLENVLF